MTPKRDAASGAGASTLGFPRRRNDRSFSKPLFGRGAIALLERTRGRAGEETSSRPKHIAKAWGAAHAHSSDAARSFARPREVHPSIGPWRGSAMLFSHFGSAAGLEKLGNSELNAPSPPRNAVETQSSRCGRSGRALTASLLTTPSITICDLSIRIRRKRTTAARDGTHGVVDGSIGDPKEVDGRGRKLGSRWDATRCARHGAPRRIQPRWSRASFAAGSRQGEGGKEHPGGGWCNTIHCPRGKATSSTAGWPPCNGRSTDIANACLADDAGTCFAIEKRRCRLQSCSNDEAECRPHTVRK